MKAMTKKLPKGESLRALSAQIMKDNPKAREEEIWGLFEDAVDRQKKRRRLRRNGEHTQLQRDREARGRALTNAEKQKRWRERHAEDRRVVAHIAAMLMRRDHSYGQPRKAKIGWNTTTFDEYFYTLATLISDVLKTDQAIRQLKWALAQCLDDRRLARARARSQSQSPADAGMK
jgi:hypothetical protein